MKRRLLLLSIATTASISGSAWANAENQIPSCYVANKMPMRTPAPSMELFILIHETTHLDSSLVDKLHSITRSLIKPGVKFSVLRFSSLAHGRYLNQAVSGIVEHLPTDKERASTSVRKLKNFDECMSNQARYGLNLAIKIENDVLAAGRSVKSKESDIIASLAETSKVIKFSVAPKKMVLLVSDMLENSSITRFHVNSCVRNLNPGEEVKKVHGKQLIGDFGGASFYAMGAGMLKNSCQPALPITRQVLKLFWQYPLQNSNPQKGVSLPSPQTMQALKSFWQSYFQKSNAKLIEFGAPTLLGPVQWSN